MVYAHTQDSIDDQTMDTHSNQRLDVQVTAEVQESIKTTGTIQQDVGVSQPSYYEYTEVFVWGEDRNG